MKTAEEIFREVFKKKFTGLHYETFISKYGEVVNSAMVRYGNQFKKISSGTPKADSEGQSGPGC